MIRSGLLVGAALGASSLDEKLGAACHFGDSKFGFSKLGKPTVVWYSATHSVKSLGEFTRQTHII